MKMISVQECQAKIQSNQAQLIDIREQWEHTIYSIDALHLPMAELVEKAPTLDTDAPMILVCKSGRRAEALANLLETEYGFTDVSVLEGGIIAWAEINDPTNELY